MANVQAVAKLKDTADNFNTILFGATPDSTMFYRPVRTADTANATMAALAMLVDKPDDENLISIVPDAWELSDERIKILGKLYLSLDELGRKALIGMTQNAFGPGASYSQYSAYLFTFLAYYHGLDFALDCAISNLRIDEISFNLLRAVSNLMKYNSAFPSDAQVQRISLEFLNKWKTLESTSATKKTTRAYTTSRIYSVITRIVQQAQEIKYRRLREHLLNDANLEINQDRQILTFGLAKFGFGKELIESLEHAENEYRKADSKFDFKTALDHNRSFVEALFWETAGKVAVIRKETLSARKKSPAEVRDYLRTAGFFSDRFHKLCEAFYQFASEQSTHQLASGREVARVVRNVNIELGLLIIRRLESFK